MTLTDAGPLIALLNRNDEHHARCDAAVDLLDGPMTSTWPCFSEAMHILGKRGGYPPQASLWGLWRTGVPRGRSVTVRTVPCRRGESRVPVPPGG